MGEEELLVGCSSRVMGGGGGEGELLTDAAVVGRSRKWDYRVNRGIGRAAGRCSGG